MTLIPRSIGLLLQNLADTPIDNLQQAAVTQQVQRELSIMVGPEVAARIEYCQYELNSHLDSPPSEVQGLSLTNPPILLSDIFNELRTLEAQSVRRIAAALDLTSDQVRAAFFATYWILRSIEWESHDHEIPQTYTEEQRRHMLQASLGSLQNYRATGDP